MIPFKVKLLTETAKAPTQENEGDLWDLYADKAGIPKKQSERLQKAFRLKL